MKVEFTTPVKMSPAKLDSIYSVTKSHLMMQRSTFYPVIGSVCIPDLNQLHTRPDHELAELRPTHVTMADKFASFGMTMSDGTSMQAGKHPCTKTFALPVLLH